MIKSLLTFLFSLSLMISFFLISCDEEYGTIPGAESAGQNDDFADIDPFTDNKSDDSDDDDSDDDSDDDDSDDDEDDDESDEDEYEDDE